MIVAAKMNNEIATQDLNPITNQPFRNFLSDIHTQAYRRYLSPTQRNNSDCNSEARVCHRRMPIGLRLVLRYIRCRAQPAFLRLGPACSSVESRFYWRD
jgi:hypothetical protein